VSRLARRRPGPDIGLTPMIDMLFLVLMFLLLTTTFREATFLRVTLPEAASGSRDAAVSSPQVRLVIDEQGVIAVGDRPITLDDLARMLAAIGDADAAYVRIAADERVDHGRVVAVMDTVRRAGIHRVMIETSFSTQDAHP